MARKKKSPTKQVRVAKDVAEIAVIVAGYRRCESSDLLTEILRPILTRMHEQEMRRTGGAAPPSSPALPKKGGGK
ncbi:MAG TPA: hypothetical protein VKF17_16675 [Isosphaeraceae bacterium]|nr:hypothetical protein [Isosphaeraceae bacterium]